MRNRDPKGYYAALNIGPQASQQEIRLGYELLKQASKQRGKSLDEKVQVAYETLGDLQKRREYDPALSPRARRGQQTGGRSRLNSTSLLVVLVLVLVGILAFTLGPTVRAHFVIFDVGDQLVWRATSKPLGELVEFDAHHVFENGTVKPAYRIQPTAGEPVWYPAGDLNRHCAQQQQT